MWTPGVIFSWSALILVSIELALLYRSGRGRSEQTAITVWLSMNTLMLMLTPVLYKICSIYVELSYLIWYATWAALDVVAILAVYVLHRQFQLTTSKLAAYIALSFVALTFIQAAGFVDRVILNTQKLDDVYRFLILSINFAVVPVIFIQLYRDGLLPVKGLRRWQK